MYTAKPFEEGCYSLDYSSLDDLSSYLLFCPRYKTLVPCCFAKNTRTRCLPALLLYNVFAFYLASSLQRKSFRLPSRFIHDRALKWIDRQGNKVSGYNMGIGKHFHLQPPPLSFLFPKLLLLHFIILFLRTAN